MSKPDDFVHLHTHSDMSQLDGCGRIDDYVNRAVELQHRALSFTEHGTMRGFYTALEAMKEKPIKPVYGTEFYVAEDMYRRGVTNEEKEAITAGMKKGEHRAAIKAWEELNGIRDRWHLTVWAKNDDGIKSLFKLSSLSYTRGYYYKPRIDLKTLIEHKEGLMVATGCLSSPINDRLVSGKRAKALETVELLREAFGEDLWLEVQPHRIWDDAKGADLQEMANRFILDLRRRWGSTARLLATQDAHYVHKGDDKAHEVLLCIGTGTTLSDPNRFKFSSDEFWFKTRDEMETAFKDQHPYFTDAEVQEALDNTVAFSEICTAKIVIDKFKTLLPPVEVPPEFAGNEFAWLKELCRRGWAWREIPERVIRYAIRKGISVDEARDVYVNRLTMELGALKRQRFIPYFLIVRDLYDWVRRNGIACGPGRGSSAGSLIAFLLGITALDPIEHGLLFERFISPGRQDLPDIDMDFEHKRRGEILQYLRDRYGDDKTCQIATHNKLKGKQCVKDVCRVLGVPFEASNKITDLIMERSPGDARAFNCVEDSFAESRELQEFNRRYPDVLKHAKTLEGMTKAIGVHAAGVVVSPVPLDEVIPLEVREDEQGNKQIISAVDMNGVQGMGLVKMDNLGLENMTVLREAVEAIKERHGVEIDLEKLDLDDQVTLDGFTAHDFVGVFQYDSYSARKVCEGVKFTQFEDIATMTALNRPGTASSGLAEMFVKRKNNPALAEEDAWHPKVTEATADTLGVMTYQEHVIKVFRELAGYDAEAADKMRKKIGKRLGDEAMEKEREAFIEGVKKTTPDCDLEKAEKLFDAIVKFGSYGFNKSHASAYGLIGYWCMYLKLHYPAEFYWALMRSEDKAERRAIISTDAQKHGVDILPPDVNTSKKEFSLDGNAIRGSIVDIKNVGDKAADSIIACQPFASFADFCHRVERKCVNKRVVESLAKAGALDSLAPNPKWLLDNLEGVWTVVTRKKGVDLPEVREKLDGIIARSAQLPGFSDEERMITAMSVNPLASGKHPLEVYENFLSTHVKVPLMNLQSDDFWKDNHDKGGFIVAVVVESKVGQSKGGDRKKYGAVSLECANGVKRRMNLDLDNGDDMPALLDVGPGNPVIIHVSVNGRYESIRGHFFVDVEKLRKKLSAGEPLELWERVVTGDHPLHAYPWTTPQKRDAACADIWGVARKHASAAHAAGRRECSFRVHGVVTHVRTKPDKKGQIMAFFGLQGVKGYLDVLCFASMWPDVEHAIKQGHLLEVELTRELRKDGGNVLSGPVKWLKRSAAAVAA